VPPASMVGLLIPAVHTAVAGHSLPALCHGDMHPTPPPLPVPAIPAHPIAFFTCGTGGGARPHHLLRHRMLSDPLCLGLSSPPSQACIRRLDLRSPRTLSSHALSPLSLTMRRRNPGP
jgi:hypothetical protein